MVVESVKDFFISEFALDPSIFPTKQSVDKGLSSLKLMKNKFFVSHRSEIDIKGRLLLYLFLQTQSKYDMQLTKLSYPAIEGVLSAINKRYASIKPIAVEKAVRSINSIEIYNWESKNILIHIEKGYAYVTLVL